MAAIVTYVHYASSRRVTDLCPKCFNPSLQEYTLERISLDGITPLAYRTGCTDCKIWVTEKEDITNAD